MICLGIGFTYSFRLRSEIFSCLLDLDLDSPGLIFVSEIGNEKLAFNFLIFGRDGTLTVLRLCS